MNAHTEKFTVNGPAGVLACLRDRAQPQAGADPSAVAQGRLPTVPATPTAARGVALIAHPHPLFGGSMDNKVVQTLARAFVQAGWDALRFNFRGVGGSAGVWDEGRGELADFLAVLQDQVPEVRTPLAIAGFSFGAFVASQAVQSLLAHPTQDRQDGPDRRPVQKVVLVGTAASRFDVAAIPPELQPQTLVLHGEQDDTVALSSVMDWARPQALPVTVVPGAGHFFHGQLPLLKRLVWAHVAAPHAAGHAL